MRAWFVSVFIPAVVLLAGVAACNSSGSSTAAVAPQSATPAATEPSRKDLPVPERTFKAPDLKGTEFDSASLAGKKLVLGFFSYKHRAAAPMLSALEKLRPFENDYQFRVIAVSINSGEAGAVKSFRDALKLTLPILVEGPALEIATGFDIENEVTPIVLDNRHRPFFGLKGYPFADIPGGEDQFLSRVKEALGIRERSGVQPRIGIHPVAPDFETKAFTGETVKLVDYRGKTVLLIFFSPKCPHCQHELTFLKEKIYPEYVKHGFEIIAASLLGLEGEVLDFTKSLGMPWPVVDDSTRAIRKTYSGEIGVPENFFIDKEGKVRFASTGFNDDEAHVNLYTMRLRALLGLENPPLLSDKRFNGDESCLPCHEPEHVSWSLTPHAHAWESLEVKGENGNAECVRCHSLGIGDPRGFSPVKHPKTGKEIANAPEHLRGVQCESCHGIGGTHVSKPLAKDALKAVCLDCHTEQFSLHFDFDQRLAKVDHSDALLVAAMNEAEKLALLKKAGKNPEELFGAGKHVGNEACGPCHEEAFARWKDSVHGKAVKDFSPGASDPLKSPPGGVACEACHGPGERHSASKRKEDVRGLGEDCPFCVIEQICTSCHGSKNDPDFNLVTDLQKIRNHR